MAPLIEFLVGGFLYSVAIALIIGFAVLIGASVWLGAGCAIGAIIFEFIVHPEDR